MVESVSTLTGHSDRVNCVAFIKGGNKIATASRDKKVKVWNIDEKNDDLGQCICTFEGHSNPVTSVAFSEDGKKIVSGSSETIKLWDLDKHKCIRDINDISGVTYVVFSKDGNRILAHCFSNSRRSIEILDVNTGERVFTLQNQSWYPTSIAFSKDGNKIVSSPSDRTVKVWNVDDGKCICALKSDKSWPATAVAFSKDESKIVAGFSDASVKVWKMNCPECICTLNVRPSSNYGSAASA